MTSINLLSPLLFYQNPVDFFQTQNGSTQMTSAPTELNSCRGCNYNLASNNPASQYQRQKLIQNTVRVASSLYSMNLAGLSGYQKPLTTYQIVDQPGTPYVAPPSVYWNQMSDRVKPSNQTVKTGSGSTYHGSSTRHTIVRHRPGAMSPGGVGVDIKHNSYERRLNKLKGKAPLRRGPIPPEYGSHIPFNSAYPVYGGKIIKTAIVNGCDCVGDSSVSNKRIYGSQQNAIQDKILSVTYTFSVNDYVWAKKYERDTKLCKAQIVSIDNAVYTITFSDDGTTIETGIHNLYIYSECNCSNGLSIEEKIVENSYSSANVSKFFEGYTELSCHLLDRVLQV
jgi:hypothetical protein